MNSRTQTQFLMYNNTAITLPTEPSLQPWRDKKGVGLFCICLFILATLLSASSIDSSITKENPCFWCTISVISFNVLVF